MAELSKAIARLMEEQRRDRAPLPPDPPEVREVVDSSRSRVAPGERALAEHFVRLFAAAPGATGLDEKHLSSLAMIAFRFLMERSVEEPRVRVFSPDLAHEGWEAPGTVIQVLMRDRPYIVDTVRECLRDADCRVEVLLAPTFQVERDPRRAVLSIDVPGPIGPRETFVHVEIERHPEPQAIANLVADRLRDVILATEDEAAMRSRLEEAIDNLRGRNLPRPWASETTAAIEFLEWLGDGNFVFLGYREYELSGQGLERLARVRPGSGLGILQSEDLSRYARATPLSDTLRRRLHEPPLLMLSKTNARSTVYRRDPMDYVGLKSLDTAGVVSAEHRFLGLFTEAALSQPSSAIPLLRDKLTDILEAEGVTAGSREGRRIAAAFDALPRSETTVVSASHLHTILRAILASPEAGAALVESHPDVLDRGAVVAVAMPRERFAREMYARTEQRLVRASGATAVLDRALVIADDHVHMHFYLAANADSVAAFRLDDLRAPVMDLLRTWEDRLRDELQRLLPPQQIDAIVGRYNDALPAGYKAEHDIATATQHILRLESVRTSGVAEIDLADDPAAPGRFGILRLFHADRDFILGEWIRSVGRLGLEAHDIEQIDLKLGDGAPLSLVSLRVRDEHGPLDLARTATLTIPALQRLQQQTLADDELNALIPRAGLTWREVDVLRACVTYATQCGVVSSRDAAVRTVTRQPQSARLLWEYFAAKFDPMEPAPPRDRSTRSLPDVERRFAESLRTGQSEIEQRCLLALLDVIKATVRTNYFLSGVSGTALDATTTVAPPLALEVRPGRLSQLSGRQPARETFVSGLHLTGFHLRDAAVARGAVGIYDNADTLRRELLRRLDVQVGRNAAIVPHAAQGGLVLCGDETGPQRRERAYRAFLGALIDLVDNVEEGRPKVPVGIVAYDDPDPYRVVGPGAGTEDLLEAANDVARRRDLWIGAGFAALAGREEKKNAAEVTARGALESARRHFAEIGRDIDREEIDVAAVGNLATPELAHALLLSRRFRLRAAFDDRHVFLDPNPDIARSFAERERLFGDVALGWDDFDRNVLGEGGAVYARSAKRLEPSPAARDMLGLDSEEVGGEDLVRAILRMECDLLLTAGGGVFAKAIDESHADAGDPRNDAVRVDGNEIAAKVVAELRDGVFTQAGRVDYALAGGLLDSAAIDLAAEIQLRDRQVNVEIAISPTAEGPRLAPSERLPLAAEARARNAEITLGRCRDRVRAISLDRRRSMDGADDFADAIALLERDGFLDRRRHHLPERESLRQRRGRFQGLTHPEISMLEAHTKVALREQLIASNLPDDPFFESYLRAYFPEAIDRRCGQGVRSHRLRRSIIAAELANAMLDCMGATFPARLRRDTGASSEAIARCWAVAVRLSGAEAIWRDIGDADPALPAAAEQRCWNAVGESVERATRWLLRTQPEDTAAAALFDVFGRVVEEVTGVLEASLPPALAANTAAKVDAIASTGVPRALAQRVALHQRFPEILDIAAIAIEHGFDATFAAVGYFRLCDLLDLEWLDRRLEEVVPRDRWEKRVRLGLAEDLMTMRRDFATDVLSSAPEAVDAVAAIDSYLVSHQNTLTRIGAIIDDITTAPRVTLAALSVVIREIGRLAAGRE